MLYCRIWNERKKYLLVVAVLFVVVVLPLAQAQRGAIVLPRNLAQLSGRARVVVRARVIAAQFEPHPKYPNLDSVVVTLSVEEILKGTAGKTLTFRQFVWDPRDRSDRLGYRYGEEVLLFLNPPTTVGFTSPVGLEQGRFLVLSGPAGSITVLNGARNRGLSFGMTGLPETSKLSARARQALAVPPDKTGPLQLDVVREIVRTFATFTDKTQ
jgi:hypothetical protein